MSIDPAAQRAELPSSVQKLDAVDFNAGHVYVFDFDGVVSSSVEDDLYNLESWDGEVELLSKAAACFRIRCGSMEMKYQRHLLYQAAALHLGVGIEPGPAMVPMAKASERGRVFVLTARSGWHAVERIRLFLKKHTIFPIDVFNVGRVHKDRQVDLLCREFKNDPVFYVEDNPAHLATAHKLQHANLNLVLAERRAAPHSPSDLRRLVTETIAAALTAHK